MVLNREGAKGAKGFWVLVWVLHSEFCFSLRAWRLGGWFVFEPRRREGREGGLGFFPDRGGILSGKGNALGTEHLEMLGAKLGY